MAKPESPTSPASPKTSSLWPLSHQVVHPGYLKFLHPPHYAYSGKDYSLSSKFFMQSWWSFAVTLVPWTVAPNMLTLLGFLCSCSMTGLVAYFQVAGEPCPNWVWLCCAAALFGYQTLDAIDGKQARRTRTGGAMGELFDHGCDALFTPMLQVVICVAVGYDTTQRILHCSMVALGLFLSIFEQYNTGTLDLGYINGPVDGILIMVGVFVWTFLRGTAWWLAPFAEPIVVDVFGLFTARFAQPNELLFIVVLAAMPITGATNVLHALTMKKAHDKISFVASFFPQMLVFGGLAWVLTWPPLPAAWPFAVETMLGLFASFTVTRLTISRLCRSPFRWDSQPFRACLAYVFSAFMARRLVASNAPVNEGDIVWALGVAAWTVAAFELVAYAHMIAATFQQFSTYLGINLLTLTAKQLEGVRDIVAAEKAQAAKKAH